MTAVRRAPLLALLGTLLLVGCNDEGLSPRAIPVRMTVTGGATQAGTVGGLLDSALTVQVTDQRDQPVSGVIVTFTVPPGAGTLSRSATTTDAQGLARSRWTLPTVAGSYEANVKASGLDSLVFVARATAGAPSRFSIVRDTVAAVRVDSAEGHPVTVEVRDAYENLVRGAAVLFATRGGGAVRPARVTTDSNGRALALWLPGPDSAAGHLEVRADTLPPLSLQPTPGMATRPSASAAEPLAGDPADPAIESLLPVARPEVRVVWGWLEHATEDTQLCWSNALGVEALQGEAAACEAMQELP